MFSRAEKTFVPPEVINSRLKVVGTNPEKVMSFLTGVSTSKTMIM